MQAELTGPSGAYTLVLEILAAPAGSSFRRHRMEAGIPIAGDAGRSPGYLVVAGDACSLVVEMGEAGLTLHELKMLGAAHALVTAHVTAGPGAPAWLPAESSYLLFQGDREEGAALKGRFVPLDGAAAGQTWPEETTPLDQLAQALGRSVARANAALARIRQPAGSALVARVTFRVGVAAASVSQGRVLVTLRPPGADEAGQYVELTLSAAPGAPAERGTPTAPGAPAERGAVTAGSHQVSVRAAPTSTRSSARQS